MSDETASHKTKVDQQEDSDGTEDLPEGLDPYSEQIPDFLPLYRSRWDREILAVWGFLIILILFRFSAFLSLNTAYLGGAERDAGLYIWLTQSNISDLFSKPWFNTEAFYPYSRTLAWSDNYILPSLLAAPLLAIGAPLVVAYNLVLLLASFLNGYATYRLCYRLTGNALPSFVGGTSFLTAAYLTAQLGHPQLQFAFFFPLGLSVYLSYFSSASIFAAIGAGLVVSATFLTTAYYALFLVTCYVGLFLVFAFLRPNILQPTPLLMLAVGLLLGALPLTAVVPPYLEVRELFGQRELYEAYYFSATALSYLSSAPLSVLYSWTSDWTHAEAYLFSGILIIILVVLSFIRLTEAKSLKKTGFCFVACFLIATASSEFVRGSAALGYLCAACLWLSLVLFLILARQMGRLEHRLGFQIMTNRGLIASFLFLALLFCAISFGPLGNPEKGQLALGPFRFFYELLPGFNSIRAISRAGVVVIFSLSVLAAFTLSNFQARSRQGTLLTWVSLAVVILEGYHYTYPLQPLRPQPSAYDYLKNIAFEDEVAISLPLTRELKAPQLTVKSWGDFAELNVDYMNWAAPLELKLVNGYSGQRSKIMKEFPRKMLHFPDRTSLNALVTIPSVRYVLYHSQYVPGFNATEFIEKINQHAEELSFVMADGDGTYLLKYHAKLKLNERIIVHTPSYPKGTFQFEAMALYLVDEPDYALGLMEKDHLAGAAVTSFPIKADQRWKTYSVKLPEPTNSARPFRLFFEIPDDLEVYIRNTLFIEEKE